MSSLEALIHLRGEISDGAWEALLSNVAKTKAFAEQLEREEVENTFFVAMSDPEAIECLVREKGWERERATKVVELWRAVAAFLGYTGPICWRVKPGFTLKQHSPLAGPCYDQFKYLQDWSLPNDAPTGNWIVFYVPKLVPGSTSKTVEEQVVLRDAFRVEHNLPENHMTGFGPACVHTGVLLARCKKTGIRELPNTYTRSDTLYSDGARLSVGRFGELGLSCLSWWDDRRNDYFGFVPLGVEELPSAA
jgi:hypothetical protein